MSDNLTPALMRGPMMARGAAELNRPVTGGPDLNLAQLKQVETKQPIELSGYFRLQITVSLRAPVRSLRVTGRQAQTVPVRLQLL